MAFWGRGTFYKNSKSGKNFDGVTGKREKNKKNKKGEEIKKKETYHYFVSLFNIGPYDRKKQGKVSAKFKGGGGFLRVAIIYTHGL